MAIPPLQPCLLPTWYDRARPEDQAALETNCAAVNAESARRGWAAWRCLVEWIELED